MLRNNELEMKEMVAANQKVSLAVGAVDSLNVGAIFAMFLKESLQRFLEETAKVVMFPIAAAASIIQAILAWRQAYLEKGKNSGTIVRALVETGAAIAITTAVVGSLAFTTLFSSISPIIFTAVLGVKTLFHAGSACYYLGKSIVTPDLEKKREYQNLAKGNAISTIAAGLVTAAVATVMVFGKIALAGIGVAAGLFGTAYAVFKGFSSWSEKKKHQNAQATEESRPEIEVDNDSKNVNRLSLGASMARALGLNSDNNKDKNENRRLTKSCEFKPNNNKNGFGIHGQFAQSPANVNVSKRGVPAGESTRLILSGKH